LRYERRGVTCVSKRLQSIQTPLPVCWRESRAAMIAPCAYRAVCRSTTATPTLQGGPSGSPVLSYKGKGIKVNQMKERTKLR
jgi:hypothetical protein